MMKKNEQINTLPVAQMPSKKEEPKKKEKLI
jgi:hypothetical protein